ncbi:mitochondrial ribosomal protein [Diaporthe helianthi]|uniref:Mitochondrial ribosomal protein n=1 Tax=Diaporthe helianthi TaxID=158607 RepID=A0A2P5IEY5_DIAHE|nr:mitochondrial ribosomal protein [Diaporthe helianthi]
MAKLPTALLPRSLPSSTSALLFSSSASTSRPTASRIIAIKPTATTQQVRHATEVVRPKRPYTFTQIVQLSDGSTYTTRSTSPAPVLRSTKDTRNHLTWQPSEASLKNIEVDEAGRLASFRGRFGSMYDLADDTDDTEPGAAAAAADASSGAAAGKGGKGDAGQKDQGASLDNLSDLMATYVRDEPNLKGGQVASNRVAKKGKKK